MLTVCRERDDRCLLTISPVKPKRRSLERPMILEGLILYHCSLVNATWPIISQTTRRLPVRSMYITGSVLALAQKKSLRSFAHPFPKFYRGQKVRNLVSIFDPSRLWIALVSKMSNICQIQNKQRRSDCVLLCLPNLTQFEPRISEIHSDEAGFYWDPRIGFPAKLHLVTLIICYVSPENRQAQKGVSAAAASLEHARTISSAVLTLAHWAETDYGLSAGQHSCPPGR